MPTTDQIIKKQNSTKTKNGCTGAYCISHTHECQLGQIKKSENKQKIEKKYSGKCKLGTK
jgi:hypothetical protein